MGVYVISLELTKIQRWDIAVFSVTIKHCRLLKCPENSRTFVSNVRDGDNWSSTSRDGLMLTTSYSNIRLILLPDIMA